jgi:hypothetical protein
MHFDALLVLAFLAGAFSVAAVFLADAAFTVAGLSWFLVEQPLFVQRPAIISDPHSQNSAK